MLTIKYRMSDGTEIIEDGIKLITTNVGEFLPRADLPEDHPNNANKVHRRVVTAFLADGSTMTYGPVIAVDGLGGAPALEPIVYVMNEGGATVGKYSLL